MDGDDPRAVLQRELGDAEDEIAELRDTAERLRRQIGERWFEPMDASERAALITAAEEQEALIETLETRREGLRKLLEGTD